MFTVELRKKEKGTDSMPFGRGGTYNPHDPSYVHMWIPTQEVCGVESLCCVVVVVMVLVHSHHPFSTKQQAKEML